MTTDRIVKQVVLKAPLARVWRAVSDSKQFGAWFGMALEAPFADGAHLKGKIVPTVADAQVAKMQEPHAGMVFDLFVERIEPMRHLSFRWHPYAIEPGSDYSKEPTTLVTFELEEVAGGVRLTITESGFDKVPLARRAEAFKANEGGWEMQTQLIAKYVAANP